MVELLTTAVAVDPVGAEYDRAVAAWLAGKARCTQVAYRRALEDLRVVSGRPLWAMTSADVAAWLADLRGRGLAESSCGQYLAAVSSFYTWARSRWLVIEDGRERGLWLGSNPARAVDRPRVAVYGKASYLDTEELRAFLGVIRRSIGDAVVGSLAHRQGLRDYALMMTYVSTGRRNSEIRRLRWGDLTPAGGRVYYQWQGKGRFDRHELPSHAWQAIVAWTGSWPADPVAGDYVFRALDDRAGRLPGVEAAGWAVNRPLSARSVERLVQRYARMAGLNAAAVHVHTLRHAAAMLRLASGENVLGIQALLGHATLATTQIYLAHVRGQEDVGWGKAATLLGL